MKVNKATLELWVGDDSQDEILDYLLSIINGEFPIEEAAKEINMMSQFVDENLED